jgi:hypothetical protein
MIYYSITWIFWLDKNSELPGTDLLPHEIHISSDAVPIRQRQYKYSPADKLEIQRQTEELLCAGIIKRSTTGWISPVVLVRKAGTTEKRMCIDFRKVNALTSPRNFPLPSWDSIVEKIASARTETKKEMEKEVIDPSKTPLPVKWLYSSCDVRSGYHQQKLHPSSTKYCGFESGNASYEFVRCPFGLKNAPALFGELMHLVTHKHSAYLIAYLDDLLILVLQWIRI